MKILFSVFLCFSLLNFIQSAITKNGVELPTFTEPCVRNSPNFDECLKNALILLMPKIGTTGLKEVGLQVIDPLFLPVLDIKYDGPVIKGRIVLTDVNTVGFASSQILNVKTQVSDPKKFRMEIKFNIPTLFIESKYKINGLIGNFSIDGGDGAFNLTAKDYGGLWTLIGSPRVVDGETYMHLDKFIVNTDIKSAKIYATDIIKGQPELNRLILEFINRYSRQLFQELLPFAQQPFSDVVVKIFNKLFMNVSYDQLFPIRGKIRA